MRDIDWDKVPDIEWDAIGGEIKRRRKLKGLSQEQLAQMVGIALSSIRRYESGERQPDEATINAIADALKCDVDVLLSPRYYAGKIASKITRFVSDKGTRLSCKIDSGLYDTLATLADENDRTLEDEVEERLYWSVENDMDEHQNAKDAQEEQMHTDGSHHDD